MRQYRVRRKGMAGAGLASFFGQLAHQLGGELLEVAFRHFEGVAGSAFVPDEIFFFHNGILFFNCKMGGDLKV